MPNFGKPDQTGRSSGRRTGRAAKAFRPPKGEPFVWLTRELMASPAWRYQSANTSRLISFLLIEHMNHAGTENGNLKATHHQLRSYGLSANSIRDAIEEADFLGLLRFERGGRWAGSNQPSHFKLTFQPDRDGNSPTNEWKLRTEEQIRRWQEDRKARRKGQKNRKAALKFESAVLSELRVPKAAAGN
jgi:hypothetical protein